MVSIDTHQPRSSPFTSSAASDFAARASPTPPVATSDAQRVDVGDFAARAEPQIAAPATDPFSSTLEWASGAMTGAKAALEHLAKEVGLQSQLAYLFGRNGQGALNREWAESLSDGARLVGALSISQNLAEEIHEHGVVEGSLRAGLEEIGSGAGAVAGAALLRGPAGAATAAVGAVIGEDLSELVADEVSAGFWSGDQLYADVIDSGGSVNDAAAANLASHQGWLTDPELSLSERVEQFAVDGLQTFGGDLAVLWNGATDWLSGGESYDAPAPQFEPSIVDWSAPELSGGWSDFDDGAYGWSDFEDVSSGSSSVAETF